MLVPERLDIDETPELLVGDLAVHLEDGPQPGLVAGLSGAHVLRQPRAVLPREPDDPAVGHLRDELRGRVESDQRDAMLPRVGEDVAVEPVIVLPAVVVLGLLEHLLLIDLAGNVLIEIRLKGLLEELHADGEIDAALPQTPDDRKVWFQAMIVVVVGLADEDDALAGETRRQLPEKERLSVGSMGGFASPTGVSPSGVAPECSPGGAERVG